MLTVASVPIIVLFVYVVFRSGPLAPVDVVLSSVENQQVTPALFGIGTVEARYTYKIGPTFAGRVKRVNIQVGDRVKAGQVLGEMDPVGLDQQIHAQNAASVRASARMSESEARRVYAKIQADRYERLLEAGSVSQEVLDAKQNDFSVARAGVDADRAELHRTRAELMALKEQRRNLSLIAPVDGLVVSRDAEPGTTVVAGQTVIELVDPGTLWIDTRFDQTGSDGLAAGLPAWIVLRSKSGLKQAGRVLRVEPLADPVTEETLAKVVFNNITDQLPPIGELAEVTILLPALTVSPVIPNAAVHFRSGKSGVWRYVNSRIEFAPVSLGVSDLDGRVQVSDGLNANDLIVVYSKNALHDGSRIHVVDRIGGGR